MKTLKITLFAALMLSCMSTAVATPLEDQAKKLYTTLKSGKSAEGIYAYCLTHKIAIAKLTATTKKMCITNKDNATYAKVTEQEIAWEQRMNSWKNRIKIIAGSVATIGIGAFLVWQYIKNANRLAANSINGIIGNLNTNPDFQRIAQNPIAAENMQRLLNDPRFGRVYRAHTLMCDEMLWAMVTNAANNRRNPVQNFAQAVLQPNFVELAVAAFEQYDAEKIRFTQEVLAGMRHI